MEDVEEKSFCYIEGTPIDQNAAETVTELHENVWYRMKPPKINKAMYSPFVSARTIELVRNLLSGKTSLKPRETKDGEVKKESPAMAKASLPSPPMRRDVIAKPDLKTRKSSVRFLNQSTYD